RISEGVDPQLLERERTLELQLESLATRQVKSSSSGVSQKELLELDNELERATTEYHDVQGQIRALSPHYAALVQPVTLKVDQIQQMLEPETLLLETSLGEKRSFLWAITRDSVKSYELPSQAEIEKLVRRLYSEITALSDVTQRTRKENSDSDARQISSMLFGKLDNRSEIRRLVIVADGVLQYLPFASLPSPFSEKDNLVSHYEIVRLPSASVLAIQREQFAGRAPASKSVAVLADPVFDKMDPRVIALTSARNGRMRNWRASPAAANERLLAKSFSGSRALRDSGLVVNGRIPRLLFSAAEADAVYAASSGTDSLKAIGFKANRSILTGPELSHYKVIHIASHGVLNSKHPELSGILLSMVDENGKPIDGFLQLHEIYNLRLPAELVVLSACETAIGKEIRGEGLIALTRGFMYAGAARVVATLWKVDDAATATLMAQFYKEMFTNGKSPAAALQAAQIYVSQKKRWQEPYYWAGFMLQGEWR
ncbi:MAG TPA: CHAT domain-containing protein, partial [Pyrinomonadaceae bacterium]|nr:CHAT domain-containing protein [Pyrinomonadaceae bacterium]